MAKIRVVLVDDHSLVRLGLKTLINDTDDIEVVDEAASAGEALHAVEQLMPDVVLMDIRLPGEGGLEATRQIAYRFPQVKVVMLTSYADEELVISGIRAASRGESMMDPATTSRLFARLRATQDKEEQDAFRDLTEREMEVLYEVGLGKTNAEIAASLNLSEKTARNYVSTILEKLHLTNRIELATYAVRHHLSERLHRE
jgi:two-component system response regulator DevR